MKYESSKSSTNTNPVQHQFNTNVNPVLAIVMCS